MTVAGAKRRIRARIGGTVQGVGFRPYVFRLADRLGLSGFVLNDTRGVLIEIEGECGVVERFFDELPISAPPMAVIEGVNREEIQVTGGTSFRIVESAAGGETLAFVAPDSATCTECRLELNDATDRRYRYPFINCTNCGPRFTIISDVPYDRQFTTMAAFFMCDRCHAEYVDPSNRRFHAEPNACGDCGPTVRLTDASNHDVVVDGCADPIQAAARRLTEAAIVAVKGLGGFHLAAAASDEAAVARLRSRKHREDKPFAIMVRDLDAARELIQIGPEEAALLESPARPIVLGRKISTAGVAHSVAPSTPELGVMLPYSPLHQLLLDDVGAPLVMTSGNRSDEPIAFDDSDALQRLAGIADCFLVHDRRIATRTDDSVTRVISLGNQRAPVILRRSRGYVPGRLRLPVSARPLVACGAELKNTFCVAKGCDAWVGHHIGDLGNYETLQSFSEGIEHFERLFDIDVEVVAHDLHPDYLSTTYAEERGGVELVGVQHHHAHLAACLAEHGEGDDAVGAIYDGTGYGLDATIWGGELLCGGIGSFVRAGHLWPVRMPGGDKAVREPWRMACAWLTEVEGGDIPEIPIALAGKVDRERWKAVSRMSRTGFSAPVTTSIGRLFDAISAICGIAATVNYEGQAAIELEAMSYVDGAGRYDLEVLPGECLVLDARSTIRAATADIAAGVSPSVVSARFHEGLSVATATACQQLATSRNLGTVVLSGGVFQNRRLLETTAALLIGAGLRVLTPQLLPPNDGGISFGQVVIAAARTQPIDREGN